MRSITLKLIYSALLLACLASCGQQTNDGAAGQSAAPVAGSFNSIDLTGAPYAQGFSLPDYDGKLRDLIAKAKANNVPNDNIDRIIKKAAGFAAL